MKTCRIPDCDGPVHAKELCQAHYRRLNRTGTTDNFFEESAETRFLRQVEKTDYCHNWTGSLDGKGYGKFHDPDRYDPDVRNSGLVAAHRWAYEHWVGPIDANRTIDHLCHNEDKDCPGGLSCPHRRCVNPEHLEPVPQRTNVIRGRGPEQTKARPRKTHCPAGHEFTEENTYVTPAGARLCRTCQRERMRDRRKRGLA